MQGCTILRRAALGLVTTVGIVVAPAWALSAGPTVGVGQGGDHFSPSSVSVPVGGTVTWRWAEGGHNVHVRSASEGFDSGYKSSGATYSHTFTHPGSYTFVCDAHQPEMRGTVAVGRAAPAAASPRPRRARRAHRRHHLRHHHAAARGDGGDDGDD
jgi:plastocyanin